MNNELETFTNAVVRAYKSIQRIKRHESRTVGIKGIHVMCLYFLEQNRDGYTLTELAALCCEDKAAMSRALDSLVEKGYVSYGDRTRGARRWRIKAVITETGIVVARKMSAAITDVVQKASDGITQEELACFYKVFASVNEKLASYCEHLENRT